MQLSYFDSFQEKLRSVQEIKVFTLLQKASISAELEPQRRQGPQRIHGTWKKLWGVNTKLTFMSLHGPAKAAD